MDIRLKVNNDSVSTESTECTPDKMNKENDIEILFQSDSSVTQYDRSSDKQVQPGEAGDSSENLASEKIQVEGGGIIELKKAFEHSDSQKSKTAVVNTNAIEGIIDLSNAKDELEKREKFIRELESNPRHLNLANRNGNISSSNSSTSVHNEEFITINEMGKKYKEKIKNDEILESINNIESKPRAHTELKNQSEKEICSLGSENLESKFALVDNFDCSGKSQYVPVHNFFLKIEKSISDSHIEINNKLDQILRYVESELDVEKSKRMVLEKKLESINKLLKNHEKELGL
jgi:hypothetical protein